MIAPGQEGETIARLLRRFRLGQHATAHRHHGVGGQDEGARMARRDGRRLGERQTHGEAPGRFLGLRRFIDIGGLHRRGLETDLAQQIEAPGACRGEHQTLSRSLRQGT
jgi:hypothetical protein